MLWYFNVRLIEIPGLLKACSCWISSKFGGVRRDKNLQLESVVLHSWTPPAFISSQSTYLTSNLQLSTIQRGLLTPYVLTGQTPQAFPLILPVLLPLYPHFYFWLTKPEEFIIPETFLQNESKPSRGRLFFFPGLSDNETMAYTQPIITATDDRWCFAMWTVTLEALFCYPEQPGSVCEENGSYLCWKEDFFIGILACQKGLNDVKIFQSSQRLSGQSSSSQTNIISRNKKQSLTSFLSLPIQALQGCDVLEPVPAHTEQEVSVIRPAIVHTHIHTYGQVRVAHSPIGIVGGNMCRHGANFTHKPVNPHHYNTTTSEPVSWKWMLALISPCADVPPKWVSLRHNFVKIWRNQCGTRTRKNANLPEVCRNVNCQNCILVTLSFWLISDNYVMQMMYNFMPHYV